MNHPRCESKLKDMFISRPLILFTGQCITKLYTAFCENLFPRQTVCYDQCDSCDNVFFALEKMKGLCFAHGRQG